jgi:hypothetical protein
MTPTHPPPLLLICRALLCRRCAERLLRRDRPLRTRLRGDSYRTVVVPASKQLGQNLPPHCSAAVTAVAAAAVAVGVADTVQPARRRQYYHPSPACVVADADSYERVLVLAASRDWDRHVTHMLRLNPSIFFPSVIAWAHQALENYRVTKGPPRPIHPSIRVRTCLTNAPARLSMRARPVVSIHLRCAPTTTATATAPVHNSTMSAVGCKRAAGYCPQQEERLTWYRAGEMHARC